MKANHLDAIKHLNRPLFWLAGIGVGLIIIHLVLIWKTDNLNFFGSSLIFWAAVSYLIWSQGEDLKLQSGTFSTFFGLTLIVFLLIRSNNITDFGIFLYLYPVIAGFSVALLASGFRSLKQYKTEFLALLSLAAPHIFLTRLFDISPLTARFSTLILWYTGFPVTRDGVNIHLPTGSIEVYSGCSGIEIVLQLFCFALLFLLLFPLGWVQLVFLPFIAVILGFSINGVRVAIMAVLIANGQQAAFDYWHSGDGSLIFSAIAVVIFGLFCQFLLTQSEKSSSAAESEKS